MTTSESIVSWHLTVSRLLFSGYQDQGQEFHGPLHTFFFQFFGLSKILQWLNLTKSQLVKAGQILLIKWKLGHYVFTIFTFVVIVSILIELFSFASNFSTVVKSNCKFLLLCLFRFYCQQKELSTIALNAYDEFSSRCPNGKCYCCHVLKFVLSLRWRYNARNISFRNSLRWPIDFINQIFNIPLCSTKSTWWHFNLASLSA